MRARRRCAPTRPMSSANSRPMRRKCRDGNAPGNIPTPGATQLGQRARGVVSLHLRTLAREGRMTVTVGRRELLAALGGAAVAWPLAARAQQPAVPVVGFIRDGSADANARNVAAFRKGLNETGTVEGQNVTVEYHWLEGRHDRLPALMADLTRRQVAVIATAGNV